MSDTTEASAHCPYLGLKNRQNRWIPHPEERNHCRRPSPPQRVAAPHQAEACLSANHVNCPVFQRVGEWEGPLPPGIHAEPSGARIWAPLRVTRKHPHAPEPAIPTLEKQHREGVLVGRGAFLAGDRMAQIAQRPLVQAGKRERHDAGASSAKANEPVVGEPNNEGESRHVAAQPAGKPAPERTHGAASRISLGAFLIVFAPLVVGLGLIVFALFGGFNALGSVAQSSSPPPTLFVSPSIAPTLASPAAVEAAPEPLAEGASEALAAYDTLESVIETTLRFDSNLRSGPGSDFEDINFLASGSRIAILGRDDAALWLLIRAENDQEGWIAASQIAGELDMSLVPIAPQAAASPGGE